MVGNLREVKGVDVLIRAAAIVLKGNADAQFEIAGGGDPLPYQALIEELGLREHVRLLGAVNDVPTFLASLDIAVLPSRAKGSPTHFWSTWPPAGRSWLLMWVETLRLSVHWPNGVASGAEIQ